MQAAGDSFMPTKLSTVKRKTMKLNHAVDSCLMVVQQLFIGWICTGRSEDHLGRGNQAITIIEI